jgi:hypothetical protein
MTINNSSAGGTAFGLAQRSRPSPTLARGIKKKRHASRLAPRFKLRKLRRKALINGCKFCKMLQDGINAKGKMSGH